MHTFPVTGPLADAITRGRHLAALPAGRLRVALRWMAETLAGRQTVQFGFVAETGVGLADANRIV